MAKYIVKRLILIIPILLGISIILFTIMNLTPGDPAQMLIGDTYTEDALVQLRSELGLDKPFLVRYANYMLDALRGDFGISYRTRNPVFAEVFSRFPHTVAITFLSIIIQLVVGVIVGIVAAVKQYSVMDTVSQSITMVLASVPDFWIGLMLLLLFSVKLGLLPLSGIASWQ